MEFQSLVSEIDGSNHDSFINNDISAMHFFSDWEMDCMMVLPIFESLAEEFDGQISFGKVNIEDDAHLAKKHKVSRVPSVLFFKKGSLIDRLDRFDCEDALRSKISCLL